MLLLSTKKINKTCFGQCCWQVIDPLQTRLCFPIISAINKGIVIRKKDNYLKKRGVDKNPYNLVHWMKKKAKLIIQKNKLSDYFVSLR